MRFKVFLGQKKEKHLIVESPWPTTRGERYFVNLAKGKDEPSQPKLIRVDRNLGVVVMQSGGFGQSSESGSRQGSKSLGLERMVHLRHVHTQWNSDQGHYQVMAEVVTNQSGVLLGALAYDLPAGSQQNGTSDKNKKLTIRSQMTGKVLQILVSPGETVSTDTPLVVIEAMKMENRVFAARPGKILSIGVKVGDLVQNGKELLVLE